MGFFMFNPETSNCKAQVDYYTEEELLECYEGHWWNQTC